MSRRTARLAVLPSALSLLVLTHPTAQAQSLTLDDPVGDAYNGQLDITGVTVANKDRRVVARVTLAEMDRGYVIVSVDRRRGQGVRLVAHRAGDGDVRGSLYAGAFTDRGAGLDTVRCDGLDVTWDDDASRVTLRMPSRCWNGGNYGAVRYAVLTERGPDSDWAPADEEGEIGSSAWVPRG